MNKTIAHEMDKMFPRHLINPQIRRCGNTTRQIDFYIQKLFSEGLVYVVDHAAIHLVFKGQEELLLRDPAQNYMIQMMIQRLNLMGCFISIEEKCLIKHIGIDAEKVVFNPSEQSFKWTGNKIEKGETIFQEKDLYPLMPSECISRDQLKTMLTELKEKGE